MLCRHVYKNICKEYKMAVKKFNIENVKKICKKIKILNHFLILLIKNLVERTLKL